MRRDTSFPRFELLPLTGALGAEVQGLDLAGATDDAAFEDLRQALFRYHVLAVRAQRLTPAGLSAVARRFGPFSGNPVHQPLEGFEDVVRFVREPDDTGKVIGEDWHMDLAWFERPPGITLLYGEEVPPVGGDTCFASLERAYQALTPGMVALLERLTGIHSAKGVFGINAAHKGLTRSGAAAIEDIEVEHPVICAHPETGRRYVFVSSVLQRFKGLSAAESRPLDRLPAGPRDAARAHLPGALGDRHADALGQPLPAPHRDQRLPGLAPRHLPLDGRGLGSQSGAAREPRGRRLGGVPAAVDEEVAAGHVAAGVGAQQQGRADQIVGRAEAADAGCGPRCARGTPGSDSGSALRSVRMAPGARLLTVTPLPAICSARFRAMLSCAILVPA